MSLSGFDLPRATDRLFFGVLPDAAAVACLDALARTLRDTLGLHGHPRPRDHFHVTLHHLGDYAGVPPDLVATACTAAAEVSLPAFQARFDRVGSFAGRAGNLPFVLLGDAGSAGLQHLHTALAERLRVAGFKRPPAHAFVPHVTLLYDARTVPVQPVEPMAWPVHEFVLIHSVLGRTEYRVLGRWSLAA